MTARPRPWRWAAALAVGLLAMVVTGHLVRRAVDAALPPPNVEEITVKLDQYRARKGELDTLFLGTSRLFFSVDPRLFDATSARLGCPTRSFNMSLAGLNFRELLYFLEVIRDDPPPHLRLVLFEPRPSPGRDIDEMLSPRRRLTMRPETLLASLDEAMANPRDRGDTWWFLGYYLAGFAYHNLGIGALSERLIHPAEPESPDQPEFAEQRRGFRPLGLRPDGSVEPHEQKFATAKVQARWQDKIDGYRDDVPARRLHAGWQTVLDSYLAVADAIPAEVAVLLPPHPHWYSPAFRDLVADRRPDVSVIYFDPLRHRDLYDAAYWYDETHLNQDGGRVFTRRLAETACKLTEGLLAQRDHTHRTTPR